MIVITGRMKRAGMCGAAGLLLGGVLFAQTTNSAYLKTKIKPGRAGVFVDGKYLGPAANFRIGRKCRQDQPERPLRHEKRDPRPETQGLSKLSGAEIVVHDVVNVSRWTSSVQRFVPRGAR